MEKLIEMKNKFSNSISIKIVTVGLLILILLIPIGMIKDLISERENYRISVIEEINQKWGRQQQLTGPILTIPVYKQIIDQEKERIIKKHLHLLPEELNIKTLINPEVRYRGMYKVIVYQSNISINGFFKNPILKDIEQTYYKVDWGNAFITLGIPDMRGIQDQLSFNFNDINYEAIPGTTNNDIITSGMTFYTPLVKNEKAPNELRFKLDLKLNGSESLQFIPVGKKTNVKISSNWENPSFNGKFLPSKRNINEKGFTAEWVVSNLNRNYPQEWIGKKYYINDSGFGVELMLPIDHYQKSMRSAKYALMFIFLTFIIFLFFEILNKKRIHPIQYLLVSAGLIIFYTLLISLSEHIGFNYAYLTSSLAIIGLISFYIKQIFKSLKVNILFITILASLYIFLFVVLQLQDYALVIGSTGLFIILGLIMYYSRNVNWYSPLRNNEDQ